MLKATEGLLLPTTIIGSLPRPSWYTENIGTRAFLDAMVDIGFREQLVLGPDSGVNGGTIVLTPRPSAQTDQNTLEWTCETPSYPSIQEISGGACVYKK